MRAQPSLTPSVCVLLLGLAWPSVGRADDDAKKACASAFANSQRLMRAGRLLEAKDKLLFCGGPQCPTVMHPDCQQWLDGVEASIPSVVFQVSAAAGPPPAEVRLSVDGNDPVVLDGRAVSLDPGTHDFDLAADGFRTVTRHLVISEGEKLRREVITLARLVAARPTDPPKDLTHPGAAQTRNAQPPVSRITLPVVVAASGAALAGVSAVYFGIKARDDDRQLDHCTPNCAKDVVDHVRREYLWTNLSIGLAAAGATTAAVLFLLNGKPQQGRTDTRLGLTPAPNGLGVSASGTF